MFTSSNLEKGYSVYILTTSLVLTTTTTQSLNKHGLSSHTRSDNLISSNSIVRPLSSLTFNSRVLVAHIKVIPVDIVQMPKREDTIDNYGTFLIPLGTTTPNPNPGHLPSSQIMGFLRPTEPRISASPSDRSGRDRVSESEELDFTWFAS